MSALPFLPEKVLDTCFWVSPLPSPECLKSIAFLAWVSVEETTEYFESSRKLLCAQNKRTLKEKPGRCTPFTKRVGQH